MTDRTPTYPGRVRLVPVAGQENVFDLVRADAPTEAGTPLNKATLLNDAAASLLKLTGNGATPSKAFELLAQTMKEYGLLHPSRIEVTDTTASLAAFGRAVDSYCADFTKSQVHLVQFRDYPGLPDNVFCGLLYYVTRNTVGLFGFSGTGRVVYKIKQGGVWQKWQTLHSDTWSSVYDRTESVGIGTGFSISKAEVDKLAEIRVEYSDGTYGIFYGETLEALKQGSSWNEVWLQASAGTRTDKALWLQGSHAEGWNAQIYADVPTEKSIALAYNT